MLDTLRRALAVLGASAALVLLAAAPASAHGQLGEALPADGSSTDAPVDAVTMWFTEAPGPRATFVVTAPDGTQVQAPWRPGEDKVLEEPVQEFFQENGTWVPRWYDQGYGVVVPLVHLPAAGTYEVAYSSVATDGEEVKGSMSFTYRGAATAPVAGRSTSAGGAVDPTVDVPEPAPASPSPAASAAPPSRVLGPVAPAGAEAAAPTTSSDGPSTALILVGGLAVMLAANVGWLAVRRARRADAS